MRTSDSYTLATALVLCAAPVTLAGVVNVFWEQNGSGWDLFASVTADTIVYNADLGDETINLPPDGVNTGLFSTEGEILEGSFVTLGGEPVNFARPFTISPSGSGSLADASWYNIDGVGPEFDPETGYRIWLGQFFVEEGATLGGPGGGPNGDTQSRIYIGWIDDIEVGLNVFDIPITVVCDDLIMVPGEFPSIQAAIDAACDGTEIVVGPGTYFETINFLGKAITLQSSDGPEVTIIEAQGNGTVVTCNSGEGPNTVLQGFTITGGSATYGGGMYNSGSSPTVNSCWFIQNSAGTNGGGMKNTNSNPLVTNCLFSGNEAPVGGGVFAIFSNSSGTFANCTFSANTAKFGGAMRISNGTVTIAESLFCENTPDDILGSWIDGGGNCFADTCDDANGNGIPDECECDAPIIFVDANAPPNGDGESWGNALLDLQAALQAAGICKGVVDEIWVAEGTYTPAPPGADRAISFELLDGIAIYGGFPSGGGDFDERDPLAFPTILSGDLNGDDGPDFRNNGENSYHIVTAVNIALAQNTILDGFTITAGNATGPDEFSGGGGLRVYASNLQLSNCWLVANTAVKGGACDILEGSSLELTGCTVTENAAERGGGVALGGSEIYVVNCLFVGNVATVLAGAIGGGSSTFTLINCTISDNTAPDVGGLRIQGAGSQATVSNCVLWDNGGAAESDQIGLVGGGQLTVGYSCIQGWTGQYGGEGNIDADPLFVDSDNDDYHLSAGSPCIDAADNSAVPKGIDEDLDGNPRFVDDPCTDDTGLGNPPIVDMGAYEFQVPCPWDLDCDGSVGASDLLTLLFLWGTDPGGPPDFDGNGNVGASDLLALLANWGPCP